MATIVLGLGAAALGSSLGLAAGSIGLTLITGVSAALGSFIDQNFILPTLFPPDAVEGARLAELRIQSAEEGSALNMAFGEQVRVVGIIIWVSVLTEVRDEDTQGGGSGGGGGATIVTYSYYTDVASLFCKTKGTPIGGVKKIIGNGKLIYNSQPNLNVTGVLVSSAAFVLKGKWVWEINITGSTALGDFTVGVDATTSGFPSGNNNGTFKVVSSTKNVGANTSKLRLRNQNGTAETANPGTITQIRPVFDTKIVENIEIYPGSLSQAVSPTIEGHEGLGQVPAWRGFAYAVFKNIFLGEFGNIIPQLNFIFDPGRTPTCGAVIQDMVTMAGYDPSFVNVTRALAAAKGYHLTGITDLVKPFQPLFIAYNLMAQSLNKGLRIFPRREAVVIDVDPLHLCAHEDNGTSTERPLKVSDPPNLQLPEAVTVKYADKDAEHQGGSQRATSRRGGQLEAEIAINLTNLVLTGGGGEANAIAHELLYSSYVHRQNAQWSLPPRYMLAQENDLMRIPNVYGITWLLRISKIDRGDNYLLKFEGTVEFMSVTDQLGLADPPRGGVENQEIQFGEPMGGVLDPPTWGGGSPADGDKPKVLLVAAQPDPDTPWGGAVVYVRREDEDDSAYDQISTIQIESKLGFPRTVLGGDVDNILIDELNEVDIEMFEGALSSADPDVVLNGENLAMLGDEVIAFEVATLIDERTYRISRIWRGLYNTADKIDSHTTSEVFTLLSGPGIASGFTPVNSLMLNTPYRYKIAAPGTALSGVAHQQFTLRDGGLKPFPVASIAHNRHGTTKDLTLVWDYVSKAICRIFGEEGAPLTTTIEQYEIDIYDDPGDDEPIATKSVETNQLIYTGAEQEADGLTTGEAFAVQIYQLNPLLGGSGRGYGSGKITIAAV